jgi:hypothetical protein
LTFGRLRVTITVGVAGAATTTLVAVEVGVVLALLVFTSFNVGLDEFKSGVGEVSSRENVAESLPFSISFSATFGYNVSNTVPTFVYFCISCEHHCKESKGHKLELRLKVRLANTIVK